MRDQPFLAWLHARLENIHRENPNVDYMHKLRAIILATDPQKETPNTDGDITSILEDDIFESAPEGELFK